MAIGRKACRECGAPAGPDTHISKSGQCQTCAVIRVAVGVMVMYPPGDCLDVARVADALSRVGELFATPEQPSHSVSV